MSVPLKLKPETQLLMEGRAKIEKGWCQHALKDNQGNVCALGAIHHQFGEGNWREAFHLLSDYAVKADYYNIVDFNNGPETTKDDVLGMIVVSCALIMGFSIGLLISMIHTIYKLSKENFFLRQQLVSLTKYQQEQNHSVTFDFTKENGEFKKWPQ